MQIIETYCEAKLSIDRIEDFLVTNANFVSVIDGATDKTGYLLQGTTGGRFVGKVIANLHNNDQLMPVDIDFDGWVDTITKEIDLALYKANWPKDLARPCACAITYSKHRREIWRVGDSSFRIDGVDYRGGKAIDDIICEARSKVLLEAIKLGFSVDQLIENDFGREIIMPMAREQHRLANNSEHPLGYPVFDGRPIPKTLREPAVLVPDGSRVIIYSDGFDFPGDTLSEMLASQQASYEADPLRIGLDGSPPSTKGVLRGQRHDDQTFVSFVAG